MNEKQQSVSLAEDEVRLLRTYLDGPRIWDAATVFVIVARLADKGMVIPVGDMGAYTLTDKGRNALARQKKGSSSSWPSRE